MDGLTGLPTHRELALRLSPSETPFVVWFDVDGLVWLTHYDGYRASEAAIPQVASIIRQSAEAMGGAAFRVAGDEFVALLPEGSRQQALSFARSTIEAVARAAIPYRRTDDPSRTALALNAVVVRVSSGIGPRIDAARDWIAGRIWDAKQGDRRRFGVVADAGDDLPSWASG